MATTEQEWPNREAFERVCQDLQEGNELTLTHVGEVFGTPFWVMVVSCLMDAGDAARAIQGAIQRLRDEGKE